MEQQKVETSSNGLKDSIHSTKSEVSPEQESKCYDRTEETENDSGDILIDHLKIEPVVTEITTEVVPVATENDGTLSNSLSKDCDANNQASFEDTEQMVEIVCIAQADTSNVDTEIVEQKVIQDESINSRIALSDEIKSQEVHDSEDSSYAVGTPENPSQIEENTHDVQENEVAQETCDSNAMSIVEEIVTTSKATYSIEIQEQDSSDDRASFISKDLIMLEVISENDTNATIVEEDIQELEIEETHEYGTSSESIPEELLLSQSDELQDNNKGLKELETKDDLLEALDDHTESVDTVSKETEIHIYNEKQVSQDKVRPKTAPKVDNHKSVIQEIVDDWIDDNNDEIPESKNNTSGYHDSVEIELKTLLAEDKPTAKVNNELKDGNQSVNKSANEGKINENLRKTQNNTGFTAKERVNGVESESVPSTVTNEDSSSKELEEIPDYVPPHLLGRSVDNPTQDAMVSKRKPQLPRAGVKVPGRHLMSQIASKAEVTEVLKERIKQKQQEIERPQGGDILFVKKIAQRLSSKLSAASVHTFPRKKSISQLLTASSENHSNDSLGDKPADDAERIETADNRELLAILEGDVDPDWSNLKPHTVIESNKSSELSSEASVPAKLDPLKERELALKQLLELPTISVKKNTNKKRRTFKPAPNKASFDIDETKPNLQTTQPVVSPTDSETMPTLTIEEHDPPLIIDDVMPTKGMDITMEEAHIEESRSGRKRKPTEKAREHEQNSSKKQKVYKGKASVQRKSSKIETLSDTSTLEEPPLLEEHIEISEQIPVNPKPPTNRSMLSKIGPTKNRIYQSKNQKMGKKLSQNISKRNIPVKKLLRQKPSTNVTNSKSVHMKSKFISSPKKYRSTMKQKVQKHLIDASSNEIKPKKKPNEIDKLLQDEGVVNLLYDVEQPERKRLIPITKSQTKVMDLHKVQRELKIRTKLVRNAVLRLRTSGGSPSKISPRSKRSVNHVNIPENENRENERSKSTRSSISSSGEFTLPAKIRNAADASVIVRRHSSSSFSSTSGSPRVSIDGAERQVEPSGGEEGPAHVTRSARRRHSQNEKNKQFTEFASTQKKIGVTRKKSMETLDNENAVTSEKDVTSTRPILRTDNKSVEKTIKNIENIDGGKSTCSESGNKISTRSNVVSSEKEIIKTKKGTKTKATLNKIKDIETESENAEEDKLSACLAEAVSALSNVDGATNRSGSTTVNRKPKAPSNVTKMTEEMQPDILDQIRNKEINFRRHGNIVQLILPSSSDKLKNGITLQIMHELQEALLLLRRDEACRVVLLTSTGTSFCEGLDLSNLIHTNKEERRVHAEEMANGVKEFIKALATFNKPIVAGIQGAAIGLGVTMLPLFDLVIASDKATFSTPYGQLGQIPEGAAILTLSQTIGNAITSELLLGGRTLTASEALRAGLVTRVLWPDRFQGELIPSLRAMSEHSSQSMEATKTLLRHNLRKKLDAALDSESYLLIQHWCSTECQILIKNYLDGKGH